MKMPFDFRGKSLENRRNKISEEDWDMLEEDFWEDFEDLSEPPSKDFEPDLSEEFFQLQI